MAAGVAELGLGCAPLGGLFEPVADDVARATVGEAWRAGIRMFDTAPLYGHGLSERRLGEALRGRPRDELVLSTKVGRVLEPGGQPPAAWPQALPFTPRFDYTPAGVRRSLEESLGRLGLDRVDIALVHDPDDHVDEALAGAFPELVRLRDEGIVGRIGAGMNQTAALCRFVAEVPLDCVLVAGRLSLLDRSARDELLPLCADRGVDVMVGGVFNSGVLARPEAGATYDYAAAPTAVVARARAMAAACDAAGVPLMAAALQLPTRFPAVTTVLTGARSAEEVATNVRLFGVDVPGDLWAELERL